MTKNHAARHATKSALKGSRATAAHTWTENITAIRQAAASPTMSRRRRSIICSCQRREGAGAYSICDEVLGDSGINHSLRHNAEGDRIRINIDRPEGCREDFALKAGRRAKRAFAGT